VELSGIKCFMSSKKKNVFSFKKIVFKCEIKISNKSNTYDPTIIAAYVTHILKLYLVLLCRYIYFQNKNFAPRNSQNVCAGT